MYAHLSNLGLKDVLIAQETKSSVKDDEDEDQDKKKKEEDAESARLNRCEKARNELFLNVGDKVLRKIDRCTIAAETW